MTCTGTKAVEATDFIVRDACELDPANPEHPDTIHIGVDDLRRIVKRHITAPPAASDVPEGWSYAMKPHEFLRSVVSSSWFSRGASVSTQVAVLQIASMLASAPQPTEPVTIADIQPPTASPP